MILLLLWRTWHVHNSITHNTGHILVTTSVGFLLSYRDSLEASALAPPCDGKGKQEVQSDERPAMRNPRAEVLPQRWVLPLDG